MQAAKKPGLAKDVHGESTKVRHEAYRYDGGKLL
jgi:hypothetical protein